MRVPGLQRETRVNRPLRSSGIPAGARGNYQPDAEWGMRKLVGNFPAKARGRDGKKVFRGRFDFFGHAVERGLRARRFCGPFEMRIGGCEIVPGRGV
jgi:hypothetical protein